VSLAELRAHKLAFSRAAGGDAMARRDDVDDYVVHDPLLERAKGKFSAAAQKERKKQTEWAGRARG
jgi:peptidyl-prolyl cis-trans isomerase SDCCAG10